MASFELYRGLISGSAVVPALRYETSPIQNVDKWVNGTKVPRPDRLAVLARWLDVSEHWLHFGPDPKAPSRLTGGADRLPSIKDLACRLLALSDAQREIVEALLLEFERIPRE